jgi:hypothetical protein
LSIIYIQRTINNNILWRCQSAPGAAVVIMGTFPHASEIIILIY